MVPSPGAQTRGQRDSSRTELQGSTAMSTGRIDVHSHGMSDAAAAELMAHGGFQPTGGYKISVRWTPHAALEYMDRHQIAAQLVDVRAVLGVHEDRGLAPFEFREHRLEFRVSEVASP